MCFYRFEQKIKIYQILYIYLYKTWKKVRQWHHQLTNLHIHIDCSRNVSWNFLKLDNFIYIPYFSYDFHEIFTVLFDKFVLFVLNECKCGLGLWFKGEVTMPYLVDKELDIIVGTVRQQCELRYSPVVLIAQLLQHLQLQFKTKHILGERNHLKKTIII